MYQIGTMQGRLSTPKDERIQFFPVDTWLDEFRLAAQAGFHCIEWLDDLHDAEINPLASDKGIDQARSISQQTGILISSLCAHCFIEEPLVGRSDKDLQRLLERMEWLLERARKLGIVRVVLPIEDASQLENQIEMDRLANWTKQALKFAEQTQIEIDIETTLPPLSLAAFLDRLPHPLLKVNYDIGNSTGKGYRIEDEFNAYGDRIAGIHIKDKLPNGPTVPLGNGAADFQCLAALLGKMNFRGILILEAARGTPGDELAWAKRNLDIVFRYFGSNTWKTTSI